MRYPVFARWLLNIGDENTGGKQSSIRHCRHKTGRIFHRSHNSSLEGLLCTRECKAGEMHTGSQVSEGGLQLRCQTVDSIDWPDDPLLIKTLVCSKTIDFKLCDIEYYSSRLYGRNAELDICAITSLWEFPTALISCVQGLVCGTDQDLRMQNEAHFLHIA